MLLQGYVLSLVKTFPKELREEIVKYYDPGLEYILYVTGLFPVDTEVSQQSREWIACTASQFGYLSLLKWIVENHLFWHPVWIAPWAARGGHLHVLEWLENNGYPIIDKQTCYNAASFGGYRHVMEWLMTI